MGALLMSREPGKMIPWKMPVLRGNIPNDLRRARLLAARQYVPTCIPRHAILQGDWDHGDIVRRQM